MKPEIYLVCPNPSIDITVSPEKLLVGELNRVKQPVVTYSGKAINAAKAATLFGGNCSVGGFMFSADSESFKNELSKLKINCDFVMADGKVRTNIKICEKDGRLTELNSQGTSVTESEKDELLQKISLSSKNHAVTVISGSLPKGCDESFYGKMSEAANGSFKIIDTEGEKLLSALRSGAWLVKPNKAELEQIIKQEIKTFDDMKFGIKQLVSLGAENVLLSLGSDGAVMSDGIEFYYAAAPSAVVKSSVGAGDSMIGVCATKKLQGATIREILSATVAAGTAAVMSEGTNLFTMPDFESILSRIKVEKV